MQEPPEEQELIRECVKHLEFLDFEVHVGEEVELGQSHHGKTDIVAHTGRTIYSIECKFINGNKSSRKRKKVREQALRYGSKLKIRYPDYIVKAYVFTNEFPKLQFVKELSTKEAMRRDLEYKTKVGLRL